MKRHLSQAHVEQWKQVASRLEARCAEIKHLLDRDGICPWCARVSYSRHFKQCNIVFQCALLGLLHEDGRGGRDGVRRLATGSVSSTERVNEEAQRTRTERRAAEQAAPASKARPERKRPADSVGQPQQRCLDLGGPLPSTGRCPQQSPTRQLARIPSRTNWTRGNSQGALRSWTIVAREEGTGGAAAGPQDGGVRTASFGVTLFAQDPNAVESKMMNPSKQFVFQRWNPKEQKLEQDPDRNALSVEQIQQLLQELGTRCKDSIIITKFNSVRKMKREPEENEKAVFIVEIALRSQEAHRAQELLTQLANCTVWNLQCSQSSGRYPNGLMCASPMPGSGR